MPCPREPPVEINMHNMARARPLLLVLDRPTARRIAVRRKLCVTCGGDYSIGQGSIMIKDDDITIQIGRLRAALFGEEGPSSRLGSK